MALQHPAILNVLVVDSNVFFLHIMRHNLYVLGITNVTIVESAEEALERLSAQIYHVVYTNYKMTPGKLDGVKFIVHLRDHPLLCHTPIVMVSYKQHEASLPDFLRQHDVEFLDKALACPDTLEGTLRQVIPGLQ